MEINLDKYLNDSYKIIKSYESDVSQLDPQEYEIIVILGGHQSVTQIEQYPSLIHVVQLIKKCMDLKIKMIGFCLGCQLIAYAIGCQIKTADKLYIGYDAEILGYQNIFRYHFDYIVANDKIDVIEYFEEMPYLFKYQNFIYGIQCHPEISPESVIQYCDHPKTINYAKTNNDKINKKNKIIVSFLINLIRNN